MKRRSLLKAGAALAVPGFMSFGASAKPALRTKAPKILIVYFSRPGMNYVLGDMVNLPVGNTEKFAKIIAKTLGAPLFRIEPVTPYPFDYRKTTAIAREERSAGKAWDAKAIPDIRGYDVIFWGHPIWYGEMPYLVRGVLSKLDCSGKTIVPFVTHEGSGIGNTASLIRSFQKKAEVREGLGILGTRFARNEPVITAWLKRLGYQK